MAAQRTALVMFTDGEDTFSLPSAASQGMDLGMVTVIDWIAFTTDSPGATGVFNAQITDVSYIPYWTAYETMEADSGHTFHVPFPGGLPVWGPLSNIAGGRYTTVKTSPAKLAQITVSWPATATLKQVSIGYHFESPATF